MRCVDCNGIFGECGCYRMYQENPWYLSHLMVGHGPGTWRTLWLNVLSAVTCAAHVNKAYDDGFHRGYARGSRNYGFGGDR